MRLVCILTACAAAMMLSVVEARAGGLAFDAAGNLYIADWSRHSIFKYTANGTKSSFATGLTHPGQLCFDGKGNLFVSDGGVIDPRSAILKITPDGKRSTFATGIAPAGMAFDHSGNLFVAQGESIFKFTPKGVKSTVVTSKSANFIGLAFDEFGNLFAADQAIADVGAGRSILKFSPDGTKTIFADGLKDPVGLTTDNAGSVYVVQETAEDAGSRAILRFSADGTRSTFATGLKYPSELCVDGKGTLFVWNGHSILKFDSTGTPSTFASDWISPDKRWEYKCDEYGLGQCAPEIVRTGTTQVALDLDEELQVHDPEARQAEVIWAPDSKRFAFNYSPVHAAHTTYETVAFYQLRDHNWVALHSPLDDTSDSSQLAQPLKNYLPKGFNPRHCAPDEDVLKVLNWPDANTAILYAPCYGRTSGELEAGFLFTLKFEAAGNWKIVKTHQMSKREREQEQ